MPTNPRGDPIWHCSRWGLPCHRCCQRRGGLLPHRFTLTTDRNPRRSDFCGAFRRVSPPGRYPAPLPCGVRTFLSGPQAPAAIRPSARGFRYDGRRRRSSSVWAGRGQPLLGLWPIHPRDILSQMRRWIRSRGLYNRAAGHLQVSVGLWPMVCTGDEPL